MALPGADLAEVHDLYQRTARLIDAGDDAGWAALFTEDGVFHRAVSPTPGIEALEVVGREALTVFARGVMARGGGRHRHWLGGILVDETAEGRAAGSCYFMVVDARGPGQTHILGSGTYRDELVRTAEGWRIHRREAIADLAVAADSAS